MPILAWLLLVASPLAQQTPNVTPPQALLKDAFQHLDKNRPGDARPLLEQALSLARGAGDAASEAEANRGLGLVLQAAKDYSGARSRFEEALRLCRSIDDARLCGHAHNSLGVLAWTEGNWKEVRTSFSAAADDFRAAGDPGQSANAIRNMTFARDLTDRERADLLQQAWELVAPLGDTRREGLILHQWGDVLTMQGNYAAAIEKAEAAARLLEQSGQPAEVAAAATSLGRIYRLNGIPEQAVTLFQKALRIQEKAGDTRGVIQSLSALAIGYQALGRSDEGLTFAKRAYDASRALGNTLVEYATVGVLAGIEIDLGLHADAARVHEPTLAVAGDAALTLEEVHLRRELAQAYAGLGRLPDALREADRAVQLGEADQRPEPLLRALEQRARVRAAAGDRAEAFADSQRALDLVERLRTTLPPRDYLKLGYGDRHQDLFGLAIALRVQAGNPGDALRIAEQARGRAFQDLLAGRDPAGEVASGSNAAQAQPAHDPAAPPPHLAVRGATSAPKAVADGRARGIDSAASVAPPDIDDITALAARLRSPLLSYWVGPRESFVWIVTPGGSVEASRIPAGAARLERLARAVSAGPADRSAPAPVPRAGPGGPAVLVLEPCERELRELFDLLVRPVQSTLRRHPTQRIAIIPHGPLFRVSFASLIDERGRYLIEDYEVHYAPAVGVFRFTPRASHPAAAGRPLFVADPDLQPPAAPADSLPPLPGARREVADAARILGGKPEMLIGPQATKAKVERRLAGHDVVHFATHAVVTDRNPLGSYLALARDPKSPVSEGRLTAAEVYSLKLDADLVVLSACRTGAGRISGDGISGLTRGFMYAGSPSVLATMWDLADEPGQFLMGRFYAAWKRGGSKAGALRSAQLDLIRALRAGRVAVNTPFGPVVLREHPSLWAAFVLMGES